MKNDKTFCVKRRNRNTQKRNPDHQWFRPKGWPSSGGTLNRKDKPIKERKGKKTLKMKCGKNKTL
jgi:hypothetical protein